MGSADAASRELRSAAELLAAGDAEASAAARERAHEILEALGLTTAVFEAEAAVWHFGHETAGPAGAATLRLACDSFLTVDVADPSRLLSLTAPVDEGHHATGSVRAIVRALIGESAAGLLETEPQPGTSPLVRFEAAPTPAFRALGRLALLDQARERDEDEHGSWPLWAAEAAVLWARAGAVPGCDVRAHAEAATCADAVLAVAEAADASAAHDRLAEMLPELERVTASDADRALLERAARALRRNEIGSGRDWRERARAFIAGLADVSSPRLPNLMWTSDVVTRSSSPAGPTRQPSATFVINPYFERYGLSSSRRAEILWSARTGTLDVLCRTAPARVALGADLWVRAFTPPDLTFLDSAPLVVHADQPDADGRRLASARLALPRGLREDQILIDITPQPAEPPADSRLGLLRRASDAGEAAATAERAGLYAEAAELWAMSAELWRRTGGERQRSTAELFRAQSLDRLAGGGGDGVREELARRMPASSWRSARRRAGTEPFLGELTRREDLGLVASL